MIRKVMVKVISMSMSDRDGESDEHEDVDNQK